MPARILLDESMLRRSILLYTFDRWFDRSSEQTYDHCRSLYQTF